MSRLTGTPVRPDELRADGNCFTLLRWILASTVMFSHGWDLTQARPGLDPSVALLSFPVSRLAVFLFFTLSGFLVTGSLVKRGAVEFALARALRLLPGLWTMLLIVPLLLWAAFGTLPFGRFATDPLTIKFLFRNALLIGGEYRLPGLFEHQPFAGAVNGSLWTIPLEVRCYLVLAIAGAASLLLPRWRATALYAAFAAVHLALPVDLVPALTNPRRLAFSFFMGVIAYLWRDRLRLSGPLALLAMAAALLMPAGWLIKVAGIQAAFGYAFLVFAFRAPVAVKRLSAAMPDYSYGIYIYAFPAQQAALALGAVTPVADIAIGFALMLPFAALSWHLVEGPALKLKPMLSRRRSIKVSEDFTPAIDAKNLGSADSET